MSGGFKVAVQMEDGRLRDGYRVAPRSVVRASNNAQKKSHKGRKALAKITRLARRYGTTTTERPSGG